MVNQIRSASRHVHPSTRGGKPTAGRRQCRESQTLEKPAGALVKGVRHEKDALLVQSAESRPGFVGSHVRSLTDRSGLGKRSTEITVGVTKAKARGSCSTPPGGRTIEGQRRQASTMPTSHLPGDEVVIGDGPLVGRRGTISAIDGDVAFVTASIFDRTVPIEVGLEPSAAAT
jgi:transcription antitermination factor NusG